MSCGRIGVDEALRRLPKLDASRFEKRTYSDPVYDCFRTVSPGEEIPVAETTDITYFFNHGYRDGRYIGRVLGKVGIDIVVLEHDQESGTPGAKVAVRPTTSSRGCYVRRYRLQ